MNEEQDSPNAVEVADAAPRLRELSAQLNEEVSNISRRVRVQLSNLDGSTRQVPLSDASRQAAVPVHELRSARQAIVLGAKLRTHDRQSLSKARTEPETVHEWLGSVLTGQFAVAMASGGGALAMRLLQVALIAGLVVLSAHTAGTIGLIGRAKSIELGLLAQSNEAELARAASGKPQEAPDCNAGTIPCADDATTVARLHTVLQLQRRQRVLPDQALHRPGR